MATLYWQNTNANSLWNDVGNWWTDAEATSPASTVPWIDDGVGSVTNGGDNLTLASTPNGKPTIDVNIDPNNIGITGTCDISGITVKETPSGSNSTIYSGTFSGDLDIGNCNINGGTFYGAISGNHGFIFINGGTFNKSVNGYGFIIGAGMFNASVNAYLISGGTFNDAVWAELCGGGTFSQAVACGEFFGGEYHVGASSLKVSAGIFHAGYDSFGDPGWITGGSFSCDVTFMYTGRIDAGIFNTGTLTIVGGGVLGNSNIYGGIFSNPSVVINNTDISGGTFSGTNVILNNTNLSGGTFSGTNVILNGGSLGVSLAGVTNVNLSGAFSGNLTIESNFSVGNCDLSGTTKTIINAGTFTPTTPFTLGTNTIINGGDFTACSGLILNGAKILSGSFTNPTGGTITYLAYSGTLTNNGIINNGGFRGSGLSNAITGIINDGGFNGSGFSNNGTINNGAFSGDNLSNSGEINGGAFSGTGFTNTGTINGGTIRI